MEIQGLSHINMRLPSLALDKVVEFYVNVLGFTIGERPPFTSSGVWLYAGGRPLVHLVQAEPHEEEARHGSEVLDHVALSCADYEDALARLESAGVAYRKQQVPQRPMRQLFFDDPAGVCIELIFDEV